MDGTQSFQVFNRGPSPAARLVFFAVLSLLLMFVDARYRYLESTRSVLSELILPLQRAATLPSLLWRQAGNFLENHQSLLEQNKALERQHVMDAAQLSQWQATLEENQHLRNLLSLQKRNQFAAQFAKIVYAEQDIFRRKVLIDKGRASGMQEGQVVMDDKGVVGQITRVYPWLSEVTLITEKDHAVPVQVQRNGLRSIAFGAGDTSHLALRYMPVSADIVKGDVLVTSGIDGTYPPNIPVARVDEVERDAAYPFARIVCSPLGGVDRERFWMVVSAPAKLPARPEVAPEPPKPKGSKKAGGH
jgi:rod shape-determining protein MreC